MGYGKDGRRPSLHGSTVSKTMLGRVRGAKIPLFTLLLSRVSVSYSQTSVSSALQRRDLREEMGNQASSKGDDPTYSAAQAPAPTVKFTEEELRSRLTKEEYHVTQQKGKELGKVVVLERYLC